MASPIGLQLGDCIAGMAALPPKSIDVVVSDPPYSRHVHTNGRRGQAWGGGARRPPPRLLSAARPLGFEPLSDALRTSAAQQFARLVRRWVLVSSDVDSAHLWRDALVLAGLEYVRTMFWHRLGAAPQFSGDRPSAPCEAIVLAHPKGRKRWNGGGKQGFYAHPVVRRGRLHPTEKPLSLMEELLTDFTDPGELVLDAFAGAGTTAIACHRLGRAFIGWELSPEHYANALQRLNAEEPTLASALRHMQGRGDHSVAASS
jgi:site-specific DNA-methyltransferase (adenine-specific)